MSITYVTKRLHHRLANLTDLLAVHELHSLPEVDEFNTLGIPDSVDDTRIVLEKLVADNETGKNLTFAIEMKSDGQFVGLISLKLSDNKYSSAEVWYKLHFNFWGKGFATESLKGIIKYGFEELNLHRIEAGCAVGNSASIRVLEKAGMSREGRKRKAIPLKSGWSDNFEFAILDEDY